jgi:hypothetical protein
MLFLHTKMGTDFPVRPTLIDTANPSYRDKHHLVHSCLIEFDDDGQPWREVGLDELGVVVVAGPSKTDYGFWLDSKMQYADFVGTAVTQEYFEQTWAASGVIAP